MNNLRRLIILALALAMTLSLAAQLGPKPDLVVKTIRASGAASISGDNIIVPITLRIENIGTGDAGPFQLAIMKALEMPPGAESEVAFSTKRAILGLKAKDSLDISGNVTIAPRSEAGKKAKIRALADSQAQVSESNEGNNISPWLEVQLPLEFRPVSREMKPMPVEPVPDLTLTAADITITPSTPLAGSEDIRVEAIIRNIGGVEARNVLVNFSLTDASGRILASRANTISSIASRNTQRASDAFGSSLFGMGDYRVRVLIDNPRRITESNEENNTAEKSFTALGPDFSISTAEIEVSPASPKVNEDFYFVIPVRNLGNGDATNVDVRWEIFDNTGRIVRESPGSGIRMDRIPAHGFNIQRIGRINFESGREGDYGIRIIVDPNNRFKEPDKSNNRAEKLFEVRRYRPLVN